MLVKVKIMQFFSVYYIGQVIDQNTHSYLVRKYVGNTNKIAFERWEDKNYCNPYKTIKP